MRISRPTLKLLAVALVLVLLPAAASAQVYVWQNKLGIGTPTPAVTMHLQSSDPLGANFFFDYPPAAAIWNFSINPIGKFAISKTGSGGAEIQVGRVNDLDGPTIVVTGSVAATSHINFSSRALKTDFADVDSQDVLSKVVDMPVSLWTYKSDPRSTQHIGPMAEDFHAAFGRLGSDAKTLSLSDVNGVALAAIQGLHELVEEKDGQIEDLRQRLEALEALLAAR